jgi:tellurite resistance protein
MPTADVEILRAASCIAGVDKNINPDELKVLMKLADRAGIGQASFNVIIEMARTDPRFYQDQFRLMRACPDEAIRVMIKTAVVDGDLAADERIIISKLGDQLGLSHETIDKLLSQGEAIATQIRQSSQKP